MAAPNLFKVNTATNLVRAVGVAPSFAVDRGSREATLLMQVLDPVTREPTGFTLEIELQPADAVGVAKTILAAAAENGWTFAQRVTKDGERLAKN